MASYVSARRLIECAICLGEQTVPRTLPCLHSFCESCLETHVKISTNKDRSQNRNSAPTSDQFMHSVLYETGQYFPCPTCREVTALPSKGVAEFRKDFRIVEFTEVWNNFSGGKIMACGFCNKAIENGGSFCVDCQKSFCVPCCANHNEKTVLRSHVMIKLAQNKQQPTSKCPTHNDESVNYHCEDCSQRICVVCILDSTHTNHKITDVSRNLSSRNYELKRCVDYLNHQIWTLQDIMFSLTCMEGKLKGKYDKTKLQMRKNSRQIGVQVFGDEIKRLCKLDEVYTKQTTEVYRRKQQCKEYLKQFQILQTQLNAIEQVQDSSKISYNYINLLRDLQQIDINKDFKQKITQLSSSVTDVFPHAQQSLISRITHSLERKSDGYSLTLNEYNSSSDSRQLKLSIDSNHLSLFAPSAAFEEDQSLRHRSNNNYDPSKYTTDNAIGNSSSPSVKLLYTVGGKGRSMGQLNLPFSATFDKEGRLVVVENGNCRLQVFDDEGYSVKIINLGKKCVPRCVTTYGEHFAVTDEETKSVKVITEAGEPIATLLDDNNSYPFRITSLSNGGLAVTDFIYKCIHIICRKERCKKFDGDHTCRIRNPAYVCSSPGGNIFVTDSGHHDVKVFDTQGHFLYKFGSNGNGRGQFRYPQGIVCDSNGNVFVADSGNDRVLMFSQMGSYKGTLMNKTYALTKPMGLAYSPHKGGKLAVTMPDPHEVTVFELTSSIPRYTLG